MGLADLLQCAAARFDSAPVVVDDGFVGGGYGIPTTASREAVEITARSEALFVDHTYTAKAMAGLIARARAGAFEQDVDGALLAYRGAGGALRIKGKGKRDKGKGKRTRQDD